MGQSMINNDEAIKILQDAINYEEYCQKGHIESIARYKEHIVEYERKITNSIELTVNLKGAIERLSA